MKLVPTLCLFFSAATAYAQSDTVFVDDYNIPCTRLHASDYRLYSKVNDSLYKEEYFKLSTHQLKAVYHKKHPDSLNYEGITLTFDEKGGKTSEGQYKRGHVAGKWQFYDQDGKLQREEVHEDDHLDLVAYHPNGKIACIEHHFNDSNEPYGKRFDENGVKIKYFPYYVMPKTKYNLVHFLARNIKYPDDARNNNVQGRLLVKFRVTETGAITKIKIARHLSPSLDAEAVRVVSLMPKWMPGLENGIPVSVVYTLPIEFSLE